LQDLTRFSSADFWRNRYLTGGHSGAGAYGRLAVYKAHIVNVVAESRKVRSVVEFGSGDGNTASLFHLRRYTGVDVSPEVIERARTRLGTRKGWYWKSLEEFDADPQVHDMAMSLDVIYHLVEDEVFDHYMRQLFAAARRLVLIYSSDHAGDAGGPPHVRHRAYSDWIAREIPDWTLRRTWKQPFPFGPGTNPQNTSFSFFRLYQKDAARTTG
jgi:SAM-dependent methyltransferase